MKGINEPLIKGLKTSGKKKQITETPHTIKKHEHQKPSALCKSQFSRGKRAFQLTVALRRQFLIPGHERIAPVKESKITKHEPMPFTSRPVCPARRLTC